MSAVGDKEFSPFSSDPMEGLQQDQGAPSALSASILKSVAEKKTTRDGNPPKRRGPKPDSKPALTRRQELNRQAQRTHRERKELYVKALEDEVLRLKEVFTTASQAKDKLAEENRHLREVLSRNGIQYSGSTPDDMMSNRSVGASVSDRSHTTTSQGVFTPGMASRSTATSVSPLLQASSQPQFVTGFRQRDMIPQQQQQQIMNNKHVDYEQEGIDFVLTLEKPCMGHLPFLMDRASEPGGEPCGHALMASCPPQPFGELSQQGPFQVTENGEAMPGTWELNKSSLAVLLDLSMRLDLDGEMTPVMAWGMIMGHPKFRELQPSAFQRLAEELCRKVRCYGFGAVIEEFEVRDAIEGVISMHA
ncbi:hypothetical protein B0I35DRAFT_475310 [Stachybotrys elegans]|uniref:BZIP domain-containing protein n=1 Tax=Stachybotrys elegans TaxID=80388 RepID=A0A8K0WX99_9HYPO|nr:hypothetical protein B0I35DRAFT_475310 [Stachybotrys elegans]